LADVLGDWREALGAQLKLAFPDAEVVYGPRTGVSRDKRRIAVFAPPEPMGHLGDRIVVATPRMVVRFWPARSRQPPEDEDWFGEDMSPLEEAKAELELFLRDRQASLGVTNLWFYLVDSIEIDPDPEEWGIEARLTGQGANLAATSA
jgi:hypothetical protein